MASLLRAASLGVLGCVCRFPWHSALKPAPVASLRVLGCVCRFPWNSALKPAPVARLSRGLSFKASSSHYKSSFTATPRSSTFTHQHKKLVQQQHLHRQSTSGDYKRIQLQQHTFPHRLRRRRRRRLAAWNDIKSFQLEPISNAPTLLLILSSLCEVKDSFRFSSMAPAWRLTASVVLLLILLTIASSAMAARDLSDQSHIPSSIQLPHGGHYKLQQAVHAKGYQYYRFDGKSWLVVNATAKLVDEENQEVGRHFYLPKADGLGGQPTWESLPSKRNEGGVPYSSVTCKVVSNIPVAKENIPWVLLESTMTKGNKKYFGEVAFVQRINTKMGLAPSSNKGACKGDIKKSPYTSDYLFYVAETHH